MFACLLICVLVRMYVWYMCVHINVYVRMCVQVTDLLYIDCIGTKARI